MQESFEQAEYCAKVPLNSLLGSLGNCAIVVIVTPALHHLACKPKEAQRQLSIQNNVVFTVCLVLSKSSQEGEGR